MRKVYIIILVYNGWEDTIECIESVLRINYSSYHIVIVDNSSPNSAMNYIRLWADGKLNCWQPLQNTLRIFSYPPTEKPIKYINYTQDQSIDRNLVSKESSEQFLTFIQARENRGYAAGNNIGIRYAQLKGDMDAIVVLNNDTVVEQDFLIPLVKLHDNEDNGLIGSKIMHYYHSDRIFSNGGDFNKWTAQVSFRNSGERDVGQRQENLTFLSGCIWYIPKETIETIGYLDEKYFMYCEDTDYSQKILGSGKKLAVAEKSKIYHKGGNSSTSSFSYYWIYKNKVRYVINNLTFTQQISFFIYFFLTRPMVVLKALIKKRPIVLLHELRGLIDGINDLDFSKDKNR